MIIKPMNAILSKTFVACAALALGATGAQAVTVIAGSSALIGTYDYTDTFDGFLDGGSNPARLYIAAVQAAPAYVVQNTYGHPSVNFESRTRPGTGIGEFSFTNGNAVTGGFVAGSTPYPGNEPGNSTGFTQTGAGGDWGVPYGFRTQYVVQFDAVSSEDRIDITSGAGIGYSASSAVSVFFRATGGIDIFSGGLQTATGLNSGTTAAGQWHNYAVSFDTVAKTLNIYVDQVSRGTVDLNTFAAGAYSAGFSNAFVSVGGNGNRIWTDNFQVGAMVPEPGSALLGVSALGFLTLRRKRK